MDLEDASCRARFLIRDRDGTFPARIDEILAEAGIQTCKPAAANSWTAACSGTNATYATPWASTNASTTSIALIKPSTRRLHSGPSLTRSPNRRASST
ncbi:hypothetical protein [Nonomuraea zeae]|uniref:hypothetical protein n=1 Tax=Nonomuraea zeae TaxID=1642303 RepID=UPI001980F2AC|nr:hypothetical protein [Nonomuraea zeae]